MELVRWEPFEALNTIKSRINDPLDESFGRTRLIRLLLMGSGFLLSIYWRARIPTSFGRNSRA